MGAPPSSWKSRDDSVRPTTPQTLSFIEQALSSLQKNLLTRISQKTMRDWWSSEFSQFVAKDGLRVDGDPFVELVEFLDPLVESGFGYEFEGLQDDECHMISLYGLVRKDMVSAIDKIGSLFGIDVEKLVGPSGKGYPK